MWETDRKKLNGFYIFPSCGDHCARNPATHRVFAITSGSRSPTISFDLLVLSAAIYLNPFGFNSQGWKRRQGGLLKACCLFCLSRHRVNLLFPTACSVLYAFPICSSLPAPLKLLQPSHEWLYVAKSNWWFIVTTFLDPSTLIQSITASGNPPHPVPAIPYSSGFLPTMHNALSDSNIVKFNKH